MKMGYWAQRKKTARSKTFLRISLAVLGVLFCLSFFCNMHEYLHSLETFRFHFFMLFTFLFIYSVFKNFWFYSISFFVFCIVSYFAIEYNGNIFINNSFNGSKKLEVLYSFDPETAINGAEKNKADIGMFSKSLGDEILVGNFILKDVEIIEEGLFSLSSEYSIYYFSGIFNGNETMFINVSLPGIVYTDAHAVFKNLADFINMQNVPIVIIGDFGIPVWSGAFSKFLEDTSLEVKNKMILTDAKWIFNPFIVPTINVLGFKEMGLDNIKLITKNGNKSHSILFSLSF